MSEQDTPERNGSSQSGEDEQPGTAPGETREESNAGEAGPRRTGRGAYITATLALAFAFFAASASGFLWWQYRQFYVALDQADSESASSIRDVRATLRMLADSVETLQETDAQALASAREMERRLEELPARFLVLEERLSSMQGISDGARRRWLRAEAEYYLTLANTELTLVGRWQSAIEALELADAKLRELADPALGAVRRRISQDLQALRSVRLPDVEGLSYGLGRLIERMDSLPMGAVAPTSFASGEGALEDAEPGLGRIWLSLRRAVTGMISVQRGEGPSDRAVTADEQALVRRQVELELELARLGALRGQAEVFQTSLTAARSLLEREFDSGDPSVESALMLIEDMLRLDISPAPPDISGSLNLLRGTPERDG